jgi:hypothetical protein
VTPLAEHAAWCRKWADHHRPHHGQTPADALVARVLDLAYEHACELLWAPPKPQQRRYFPLHIKTAHGVIYVDDPQGDPRYNDLHPDELRRLTSA